MNEEDVVTPVLLAGRYVLTDIKRAGAQATVVKAMDQTAGSLVAIKRVKFGPDNTRAQEGFRREAQMLQDLNHPNIVGLVEIDQDSDGNWFLVLEWIDDNLEDIILREGPMPWSMFWDRYGATVLDAVVYGQKQRIAHRDIKPKNILVTPEKIPKLADYGIAKLLDDGGSWAVQGLTFRFDHTPGYTPSIPEDESFIYSRDCFAFAAVAISCVAGRIITDNEDIRTALEEATLPAEIKSILERCLSEDASTRPRLASVLLAEIEAAFGLKADASTVPIHLIVSGSVKSLLKNRLDIDGQPAFERFMHQELDEVCSLLIKEDEADSVEIIGASWRFDAQVSGKHKEILHVTKAYEIGAGHASYLRDRGTQQPQTVKFSQPANPVQVGYSLETLLIEAKIAQSTYRAEQKAHASQQIFRAWRSYLRDRADLEAKRANAITYLDRHIVGDKVVFTTELAQKEELVGQERLVHLKNGRVTGVVNAVSFNKVTMVLTSGNPNLLPRRGEISINTLLAQRALTHQTQALDAVVFDRTVSKRLKSIILEPRIAKPPQLVTDIVPTDGDLDKEKREILSRALGVEDLLAIEGPPGTGKTKLISEIVVQWLLQNPGHRILLSSQTHIALDNVLERISALDPEMELIRIGHVENTRISDESKKLLLEKRVETWISEVRHLADKEMARWAEENGVDRATVETGMLVEHLIHILKTKTKLTGTLKELRSERDEAEATSGDYETQVAENDEDTDETTQLDSEIGAIQRELGTLEEAEGKVRREMSEMDAYARELAVSTDLDDLADWGRHFINSDPVVQECRERLSLLEEWNLRVGRSPDFNAALLSSAKVIAGTCVGVAGVKGMEEVSYDLCIVDEASKATATEILIPMARSKRWIIVGDPKQLPPFFEDLGEDLRAEFDDREIKATLLDRMLDTSNGLPVACRAVLRNQYRMIEPIGSLVSACFYNSMLKSPIKTHGLKLELAFPKPVMWYSTHGLEKPAEQKRGQTFCNPTEVEAVRKLLLKLQFVAKAQKKVISVAVISGYTAQVELLAKMDSQSAAEWPNLDLSCNSVDAFQGRQADVCIYSVVRSNPNGKLGFLKEHPRLNVALSRGKSALLIVGDQGFCRSVQGENPFRAVIDYMDMNQEDCTMETLT